MTVDPQLRMGSDAINGWLYQYEPPPADITQWVPPEDASKCFQKEANITRPTETPTFLDAIWPDTWPRIRDKLYGDLTKGTPYTPLRRLNIARHPAKPGKAVQMQPVPGAINMGFADGHAAKWKLQNIKNVVWHPGFTPNPDPWATSP